MTDLQEQINKIDVENIVDNQEDLEEVPESSQANDEEADAYLNTVSKVIFQRWEVSFIIVIKNKFAIDIVVLIDSGVDLNCFQEGLVPTQLYKETR